MTYVERLRAKLAAAIRKGDGMKAARIKAQLDAATKPDRETR